jgi:hypothetical protein
VLFKGASAVTPQGTASVPIGDFTLAGQSTSGLTAGLYRLIVSGTGLDALANYEGSFSITVAPGGPEVPLPGALLLMGSVLMGGAGLAKWRKASSRLAA